MLDKNKTPSSAGHIIVGKLTKAHGIRGEVFVLIFSAESAWLDLLQDVKLIQERNKELEYLSYKIKKKSFHKNGLILKVEGINTRNQAEELRGALFEVPESFFVSEEGEGLYLRELLEFSVMVDRGLTGGDQNGHGNNYEFIGKIIDFSSNSFQDLAVVKTKDGVFDVPLVDEFIVSIDHENKEIFMNLPVGLLGEV